MRSDSALIIDGYIDEPACFGVPPYISPHVRYSAGVLMEHGFNPCYLTIDQIRSEPSLMHEYAGAGLVLVISGVTVPGKYMGGRPATLDDLSQIAAFFSHPETIIGGPVSFGYSEGGGAMAQMPVFSGYDVILKGSLPDALDRHLSGLSAEGVLDYSSIDRWGSAGAPIIRMHPGYPDVMIEMETATGCSRWVTGGCSFCTESFYGPPLYRRVEGIAEEIGALHEEGARHFRLGRQPDLLSYGSVQGKEEFPVPAPDKIELLFRTIRSAAPELKTLHIDNINPGMIVAHEEESRKALDAIVRHHTPGDVAAFGMETADPRVILANNLKAMPDQVFRAIEIVNEAGSMREDGIPHLLPGLNFIAGLAGETAETFVLNRRFLKRVIDSGLLVRRVNIRKLMAFEGTAAYEEHMIGVHDDEFRRFKEWVRKEFDRPMLRRIFPPGTVLKDVIIEEEATISFGRQLGSYPIKVGVPFRLPHGLKIDTVVVDYGMRSLTALPCPIRVNHLTVSGLKWMPGIGKKQYAGILSKIPFKSVDDFLSISGCALPGSVFTTD